MRTCFFKTFVTYTGVSRLAALATLLATASPAFSANYSLSFDGVNDYATFGQASALGASNFTVECWFMRTGAGVSVSTGSGGVTAIPLVTKGRGEVDGNNKDMNYFLGINASTPVLVGDFEEGSSGTTPGLNHPAFGNTLLVSNKWYHAALTHDGTSLALYLNGILETNITVGQPPRWDSIQHAAIGSALTSSGSPSGYFKGYIDRVRVWCDARQPDGIFEIIDRDDLCQPGSLRGQWNCDQGSGTSLTDNAGQGVNGTLTGGVAWAAGVATTEFLGVPAAFDVASALTCSNPSQGYDFPNEDALTTFHYMDLENASGTFGPTKYSFSQFTVEVWFRREGAGNTIPIGDAWTGTYDAVPLIAKGGGADLSDGDPAKDTLYFLGIARNSQGVWVLGADVENDFGDNNPLLGATTIEDQIWYHAALTYDGSVLALYLNGALENSAVLNMNPPTAASIRATVATVRDSNNQLSPTTVNFHGKMDEIRLWNIARSQTQINTDLSNELSPSTNLKGYWKLNETSGSTASDSSTTVTADKNNRTITPSAAAGARWRAYNRQPLPPALVSPADASGLSSGDAVTLSATVRDSDNNNLEISFYGRAKYTPADPAAYSAYAPGQDFVLIALPDTQYYTGQTKGGTKQMFSRQIEWILTNRANANIVYVTQLGDCAETPTTGEYSIAADDPMSSDFGFYDFERDASNLPYGIAVGNHDGTRIQVGNNSIYDPLGDPLGSSSSLYNARFGVTHFRDTAPFKPYYGGSWGDTNSAGAYAHNNDNHFDLFSASGIDFVVIYLEFNSRRTRSELSDPNSEAFDHDAAIAWADRVLKTYPARRGIVVSHSILSPSATFSGQGSRVYDGLKANPNLTLMLCGHECYSARRTDTFGGNTVHTLLSDYQCRTSDGGGGYLRIMEFSPSNNVIRVRTFSPYYASQTPTDAGDDYLQLPADSFDLPYDLQHAPFKQIGAVKSTSSGKAGVTISSDSWNDLLPGLEHDWYAVVSDGCQTNASPVRKFSVSRYAHYARIDPIMWEQYASGESINNNGYSVAWSREAGSNTRFRGVEWDNSEWGATITSTFDDTSYAYGTLLTGINDSRDIVGYRIGTGPEAGFVTPFGQSAMTTLSSTPNRPLRINNNGKIIGYATFSGQIRACKWTAYPNLVANNLGVLDVGDATSYAHDINELSSAQIVGDSITSLGISKAFIYSESSGQKTALLPLDRDGLTGARGVNNSGVVVGHSIRSSPYAQRGAKWELVSSAYRVRELLPPAGSPEGSYTYVLKLNNNGLIVGLVWNSTYQYRGVVWKDNIGFYLDAMNYPDYAYLPLGAAVDVNESGRILCRRNSGSTTYGGIVMWP